MSEGERPDVPWICMRGEANHGDLKPIGPVDGHMLFTTSYTVIETPIGFLADPTYARERSRAIQFATKDGVKSTTDEELAAERALDWEMLKKFSKKILTMDLSAFSFPAGYSEPRTFLERSCDLFAFLVTKYVEDALSSGIPERRLALIGVGIIAGFHLYLQSKKPWNPVLGETFVSSWGDVSIYAEQISHHPPRSAFEIVGKDWTIDAVFNFTINAGMTAIDVNQNGLVTLRAEDGSHYEWEFPSLTVTGLLHGDRLVRVKGGFTVFDRRNKLELRMFVDPPRKGEWNFLPAGCLAVAGQVLPGGPRVFGTYATAIKIDGEVVWDIGQVLTQRNSPEALLGVLLPSDSRFRFDRFCLMNRSLDVADQAKAAIENLQRAEAKLRST